MRRRHVSSTAMACTLGALLLVAACLGGVHGMIGSDTLDVDSKEHFTIIWAFEYAAGGKLDMDINLLSTTNKSVQFMLCSDTQIDPLRNAQLKDVCADRPFKLTPCEWQTTLGGSTGQPEFRDKTYVAPTEDWYRLLQLNCDEQSYTVKLDYIAINPGGEYLSLSEVPYKTLYIVTAVGWVVLWFAWFYNWYRYRFFNIKLQRIISLVPACKALLSFTLLYYWREASLSGHQPDKLYWVCFIFVCVDRALFFGVLLLIAKGWSITRKQLTQTERNRMLGMVAMMFIANGIYLYYSSFSLFFLVITYVLLLRYIFSSIVSNTTVLIEQFQYVRRMDVEPSNTPVWIKLQMFRRFQVAMVVYISIDIIFHLWTTIFLRSMPWIEDMMEHMISALLALAVGYVYSMKPFNPYFYRIVNHSGLANELNGNDDDPSASMASQAREPLMANNDSDNVLDDADHSAYLWRPGMPVPPIPYDTDAWLKQTTEEDAAIILVENPYNTDRLNRPIEGVAVAAPAYEGPGLILAAASRTVRGGSNNNDNPNRNRSSSSNADSNVSSSSQPALSPMSIIDPQASPHADYVRYDDVSDGRDNDDNTDGSSDHHHITIGEFGSNASVNPTTGHVTGTSASGLSTVNQQLRDAFLSRQSRHRQ